MTAQLIRELPFAPVDAGPPRPARSTGPFGLLVAQPARQNQVGPQLACHFNRFGKQPR